MGDPPTLFPIDSMQPPLLLHQLSASYGFPNPASQSLPFGQLLLPAPTAESSFNMPPDNSQQVGRVRSAVEHSMAPPVKKRKPKARTMRKDDWKPFQPRIVELYSIENRNLSEIQAIVEQEFGEQFTYVKS